LTILPSKSFTEKSALSQEAVERTSINDFVRLLDPFLEDRTHLGAALRIAEAPCRPIGWADPGERTREVISG